MVPNSQYTHALANTHIKDPTYTLRYTLSSAPWLISCLPFLSLSSHVQTIHALYSFPPTMFFMSASFSMSSIFQCSRCSRERISIAATVHTQECRSNCCFEEQEFHLLKNLITHHSNSSFPTYSVVLTFGSNNPFW